MDHKLVAIDLDGTLLGEDNRISSANRQAIAAARSQGVNITLCTGRMFASAVQYARELGLDLPLITYQGALVKTSDSKKVLYERLVPADLAQEVVSLARELGYPVNLYFDDQLFVEGMKPENQDYARRSRVPVVVVEDLMALLTRPPMKILLIDQDARPGTLERIFEKKLGDRLYITRSMLYYLEFLHPEATKGHALAFLGAYLGIDKREILVIGDSYNDLEMFRVAGLKVAMGNAWEAVKEQADYVTAPVEEDGVAQALQKFVLL